MKNPNQLLSLAGLWALFLLICLGLGYQGLHRYDVRWTGGMNDVRVYYAMTEAGAAGQEQIWLHRALLPALARPVYLAVRGRTGTWNPVYVGLHVWNAAFTALAALFVYLLGCRVARREAALVAALLYLLNFQVANFLLSGMVDSLQALTLAAMVYFLLRGEWHWVALAAGIGSAGKETTLALAGALITGWVLVTRTGWKWAAVSVAVATAGTQVMPLAVTGQLSNFLALAENQRYYPSGGVLAALAGCLLSWNLWLSLAWGAPLAWRERMLFGRPWWTAVGVAAAMTLALGAWSVAGANTARPLFYLLGPIICIAAGDWLVRRYGGESPVLTVP